MRFKFALHDPIIVTKSIAVEPCDTIVEKGASGKIIDIDPDTKDLTIRLSGYYPELGCRNNCIWFAARDANDKIKLAKSRPYTFKKVANLIIGTVLVCTVLTILSDRINDSEARMRFTALMAAFHQQRDTAITGATGCIHDSGLAVRLDPALNDRFRNR